jgi:hypothetical protein
MMNADDHSAGDGLWASARASYEDTTQNLDALAERLSLTRFQLVREAKARGWRMRTKSRAADTKATIQRFKDLLQTRLSGLEAAVNALSDDAKSKRDISDINVLVRTLEKVLQLERRERDTRLRRRQQRIRLDDAERSELARRIASLRRPPYGAGNRSGNAPGPAHGSADGLAALGAGEPAAAGGS